MFFDVRVFFRSKEYKDSKIYTCKILVNQDSTWRENGGGDGNQICADTICLPYSRMDLNMTTKLFFLSSLYGT